MSIYHHNNIASFLQKLKLKTNIGTKLNNVDT